MIVSWPKGIDARGELRHQFLHATDVVPTMYDLLGIELPEVVKGFPQMPLEGVSFRSTFDGDDVPTPKETGFFSMLGSRAIWHKGWKAVSVHPTIAGWGHFDRDRWELYDTDDDPTESHDLGGRAPREAAGADQPVVPPGRACTTACRSWTAPRSRSWPTRPDRRWRRRATATSTTPTRPRCPRRRRSTSATAATRSRSNVDIDVRRRRTACCSRTAPASAGTRSTSRTASSSTSTTSSGSNEQIVESTDEIPTGRGRAVGRVRQGGRRHADHRHALALHRRREGRRGPHHDPARQLLAGRRGPQRRARTRPSPSPTTTPARARTRSPAGTISQAVVDVSGEPFVDLEKEALALMARE